MEKEKLKENGDPLRTKLPADHKTKAKELHNIRYAFTGDEIKEKGKRLANAELDKARFEDELKSLKSEHKAKIDQQDATINLMSNHISNGYEMKNVECEVVKDFAKGTKTYFYQGVEYDTVALTQMDRQTELNLINKSPAAAEKDTEAIDQEIADEKAQEEEDQEEPKEEEIEED